MAYQMFSYAQFIPKCMLTHETNNINQISFKLSLCSFIYPVFIPWTPIVCQASPVALGIQARTSLMWLLPEMLLKVL